MNFINNNYSFPFKANIGNTVAKQCIRKFISEEGKEVADVILSKGRAILPDGSFFSGVMETVNKKGDKISIKYADGFMQESDINGNFYKTYEVLKELPTYIKKDIACYKRNEGVKINQFGDNGLVGVHRHLFDEQGRVKRIVSQKVAGEYGAVDIKGGKIVSNSLLKGLNLQSQVYDQNGRLTKTITTDGPLTFIKEYLPNGVKREVGSRVLYDIVGTPASAIKSVQPKVVRYYSADSDTPNRVINVGFKDLKHVLTDTTILPDGKTKTLKIEMPVGKLKDRASKYTIFTLEENNEVISQAVISESGQNVGYNISRKKMPELKKAANEAYEAAFEAGLDFNLDKLAQCLSKILVF